jgi:hypothetical protein
MKVTIELSDKDQQVIEAMYEDADKNAAYDYVINVLRTKIHKETKAAGAKCGNIFSKGGEKK